MVVYIVEILIKLEIFYILGIVKIGIMVMVDSGKLGFVLVIWVDMDVLLVMEENEVDYCFFYFGKMYVCGYDGYMAIVLGIV